MRAEDSNFESMMEGNDSMFATNLQEPLVTPLTNPETAATEKSSQSTNAKPSNNNSFNRKILESEKKSNSKLNRLKRAYNKIKNNNNIHVACYYYSYCCFVIINFSIFNNKLKIF